MNLLTFRDTLLRIAPPWLKRHWGSRLLFSIGIQLDALVDATVLAIKTGFPQHAPPDALPYLSRERGIRRGFAESVAAFAARLLRWIDDRRLKGSPYALMRQLQGYLTGYPTMIRVVNQMGYWHTLSADGVADPHLSDPRNWDWDGNDAAWSRYWVVLYPSEALWTDEGTWDEPGTWGDGGTWGTTMTPEQAQTIMAIIAEWNPPHARCAGVVIALDPASFDPTGSGAGYPAGDWANWSHLNGTNQEAIRLGTGRYSSEV